MNRQEIKVQNNQVFIEQRPTTEEDHFGGIADRWDVYQDKVTDKKVAKLVKYNNGDFAIITNDFLRFDLESHQVRFILKLF